MLRLSNKCVETMQDERHLSHEQSACHISLSVAQCDMSKLSVIGAEPFWKTVNLKVDMVSEPSFCSFHCCHGAGMTHLMLRMKGFMVLSHGNEWCSFAWCGKADERIDCVCLVCFGQTVREHQILDQKEIGMCWKWDTAIGRMWVTNRRQRRFWWGTETICMEISWKFAFVMVQCPSMTHLPLFPILCQWFESECSDSLVNWIFDGAVSHEECWMEKVFCTMCIQHCASLCSHMWLKWVRIVTFEQILFAHQSVSGGILEKRIGIIFWFLLWKISKHGIACACWVDAPNWQCALPQSVLHCTLSHWCPLSWHIELHCGSLSSVEAQCIEMWWQMKNKNTNICNPLRNNACPTQSKKKGLVRTWPLPLPPTMFPFVRWPTRRPTRARRTGVFGLAHTNQIIKYST